MEPPPTRWVGTEFHPYRTDGGTEFHLYEMGGYGAPLLQNGWVRSSTPTRVPRIVAGGLSVFARVQRSSDDLGLPATNFLFSPPSTTVTCGDLQRVPLPFHCVTPCQFHGRHRLDLVLWIARLFFFIAQIVN